MNEGHEWPKDIYSRDALATVVELGAGVSVANKLFYGDNLGVLRESVADESVELIYLDPPFNSNANYNTAAVTPSFRSSPWPSASKARSRKSRSSIRASAEGEALSIAQRRVSCGASTHREREG